MKSASWKQVILYLAVLAAAYLLFNFLSGNNVFFNCTQPASPVEQSTPAVGGNQAGVSTGIEVIDVAGLPPEGRTTLALIKSGGPFPYSNDGTVFNNYEGLLPAKPAGYYHEYTVITPGSHDRGARRIVAGGSGEYYYTDDHYRSFKLIQE
ncbi:MAG: ribonuclease [Dehalococcoidia bacterium]